MTYEFTDQMAVTSNLLWAVTSAVGAGLCFFVLLAIIFVWLDPIARSYLDRVSFRIVAFALICNMAFGISSAVGGMLTGPSFLCGFSIFVLQFTLQLSSFLLFCIALNLQLVVVHGFNGQRLEKFYFLGSIIMSVVIAVPPYAAGQYGWDPLESDCWYTNDNRKQRIIWQITTQMMWTAALVIGEVVASATVMFYMLRHHLRMGRFFRSNQTSSSGSQVVYARSGVSSGTRATAYSHAGAPAPQLANANRYKKIVIRVALYPIASCLVNFLSIVTALHSTLSNGIHNSTDYNVLLLSDFLYGGRAIVYALLAASDPALIRGVKSAFRRRFGGQRRGSDARKSTLESDSNARHSALHDRKDKNLVVRIELSTIHDSSPVDGTSSKGAVEGEGTDAYSPDGGKQGQLELGLARTQPESDPTGRSRRTERMELQREEQRRQDERIEQQDYFKRQI